MTHACEPNRIFTATVATAWVEFTGRVAKPFSMHTGRPPLVIYLPITAGKGRSCGWVCSRRPTPVHPPSLFLFCLFVCLFVFCCCYFALFFAAVFSFLRRSSPNTIFFRKNTEELWCCSPNTSFFRKNTEELRCCSLNTSFLRKNTEELRCCSPDTSFFRKNTEDLWSCRISKSTAETESWFFVNLNFWTALDRSRW